VRQVYYCPSLLQCLSRLGVTLDGWRTVEIGTGWIPILPIFFWTDGQQQCITFDIERLLCDRFVYTAVQQIANFDWKKITLHSPESKIISLHGASVSSTCEPDETQRRERISRRARQLNIWSSERPSAMEILNRCRIDYRAPADAAQTGLADGSIDFVFSNTMLQHVPEEVAHLRSGHFC
jgi:hypothetical protein